MSSADPAAAAAAAASRLPPPPSEDVINLDKADLGLSCIFLLLSIYIAWKHGKAGMVCWPIFVSTFVAKIVATAYQIAKKDEPQIPSAVSTMTGAAVIACVSLTLIGAVYLCNTMLPTQTKHRNQKILLGVTHLANTGGIAIATYAGAPSATGEGGVMNMMLNRIGTLLLVGVLGIVCAWMWPTWRKIRRYSGIHPNAMPARWMFFSVMVAMPFWLIRLIAMATYAFVHNLSALDPVMGSFQTKLVLLFGTYIAASVALLTGGWYGVRKGAPGTPDEFMRLDGEECALTRDDSNVIEMVTTHQRFKQ